MARRFKAGKPIATGDNLKISKSSRNFEHLSKRPIEKDFYLTPKKHSLPFCGEINQLKEKKKRYPATDAVVSSTPLAG